MLTMPDWRGNDCVSAKIIFPFCVFGRAVHSMRGMEASLSALSSSTATAPHTAKAAMQQILALFIFFLPKTFSDHDELGRFQWFGASFLEELICRSDIGSYIVV